MSLKRLSGRVGTALTSLTAGLTGTMAAASAAQPHDWQMVMQPAVTDVMDDIIWFNNFTLVIAAIIVLLVFGLLMVCMIRFNARANPQPSKTSHNTLIEVIWTVVPIMVLVIIAVPSFRLLYKQVEIPPAEVTIKATGNQWYWGYEYADAGDVSFEAVMLSDDERAEAISNGAKADDVPRLLATDYQVVVPVDKVVRLQVTAEAVIHAWAMPAFGVKIDAVPGRLNETWFKARKIGTYYGQCSELCGKDHAFMPIMVKVVSDEQYTAWLEAAKDDVDAANKLLASMENAAKSKTKVAAR